MAASAASSKDKSFMNPRGGCGCKVSGNALRDLLTRVAGCQHTGGIGTGSFEDCGVIRDEGHTLLFTNDINALVGPDMFEAGRIAAYHALSDVWACGGSVRWATITLVVNPSQPEYVAESVLKGIYSACADVGVSITGGHTIYGPEAMAGLSVIGKASGGRIIEKKGAATGDRLMLSKPLGVGLALRAYSAGLVGEDALRDAMEVMTTPNVFASNSACSADCHAMTDVTGFGLMGHLSEMLDTGQGAVVELLKVPILQSVQRLPRYATDTRWVRNNFDYTESFRPLTGLTHHWDAAPLFDPQTNGGLLVAVSECESRLLEKAGFVDIGAIVEGESIDVRTGPACLVN